MDSKELKELMDFISQSNFAEFELEREGFKLKLVKEIARQQSSGNHAAPAAAAPQPALLPAAPAPAASPSSAPSAEIFQITSPMVGTFYRAPNPTAPPFVQPGDTIRKGQVICIIEAMKLMNEIESEVAGEVLEIPVSNGQPVEYGEVLFRIRVASA